MSRSLVALALAVVACCVEPVAIAGPPPEPESSSGVPVIAPGKTCEEAKREYIERYDPRVTIDQPDLSADDYGAVLNRGGYLEACDVPDTMAVAICVAVQSGQAVGITVTTTPSDATIEDCVAEEVRKLPFPSNPRLDIAKTRFSPPPPPSDDSPRPVRTRTATAATDPPPSVPPSTGCGCGKRDPTPPVGSYVAPFFLFWWRRSRRRLD